MILLSRFLEDLGSCSNAKNLQVRKNLDIFIVGTISRSWQDLSCLSTLRINVYQITVRVDMNSLVVWKNLELHYCLALQSL